MKIKQKINKLITYISDKLTSNGVMQEENEAGGKRIVNDKLSELIRISGGEGIVLLKNDGVLPLVNKKISIFGRSQFDYFYVGYGSGGDVNPPYLVNITDALRANARVEVNEALAKRYEQWREQNAVNHGWWGHWPYNFEEMQLDDEIVNSASKESDAAVVVIGRAAGEDRENKLEKGSYYLTDLENDMLDAVTKYFEKTIVLMDCGNIIDMSWTLNYGDKISSIMYVWQLGQESGNAVADVLTGIATPSGKLPDTIAVNYTDYPSCNDFGNKEYNNYTEDIYVGYRYFETFCPNKVLYPFGFGLSYTEFDIQALGFENLTDKVKAEIKVTNVGKFDGKEVVQLYLHPPVSAMGKPDKVLTAFAKTKTLKPGESQTMRLSADKYYLSSFDDTGKSGYKNCYVLERGEYVFWTGNSVRADIFVGKFRHDRTQRLVEHKPICSVKFPYERLISVYENDKFVMNYEKVAQNDRSLKNRILQNIPQAISTNTDNVSFDAVKSGEITLDEFIGSLSLKELEALSRGEGGMNSSLGVAGNAGAYGGVIPELRAKGVPPIITCDGPAGIRVKKYTSLLPCGTGLAASFNTELVKSLYSAVSEEMTMLGVDVLLAPGMNIHRNPLCGRNFEYFSEDPVLTGKIASASVCGIQQNGRMACPKHFACNNQETNRTNNDSRVSERALREIYLKAFEICVKESEPKNIMTSYNKINGVWSHYNYDLATEVLRNEWGFKGVVITDWWMKKSESQEFNKVKTNAYRVRSQVDVLMPGNMSRLKRNYKSDGSLLAAIDKPDGISLAELQRTAKNVLSLALQKENAN